MPGKRIAIIGGGLAGLAAAYELEKAPPVGMPVRYTLFESQPRLGGVVASEIVDGAVLEHGPDSFLTEKTAATDLCRELGLGNELMPSNDAGRKTWMVVRNRLVPLPDGLMFLVPTRLIPTLLSPLFSTKTKLRMAFDLLRRPRSAVEDESVAALVERHYGPEAVDRLADPLLSGIYGGEAAQLSAQTVLPRLVEMEREYGSLTRGVLAVRRAARTGAGSEAPRNGTGVFTTLRGGMQQLIHALTARLDPDSIRTATRASALARSSEGWLVKTETGGDAEFDAVILATPAWAAAALLNTVDPELSQDLNAIPYTSSITVNLIYDEKQIGALPEGFGFLVPASERRALMACTFAHRKFAGRTPPGKAVLRAFLGGGRNERLLDEPDAALIATVRRELSEILGAKVLNASTDPKHAQITRWRRAMAQYTVGHKVRMQRIRARMGESPGLRLAGNAYDGIGVSDCIRLGRQAARELAGTEAK